MINEAIRTGFADPGATSLYEILPDVPTLLTRLTTLTRPGVGQPARV